MVFSQNCPNRRPHTAIGTLRIRSFSTLPFPACGPLIVAWLDMSHRDEALTLAALLVLVPFALSTCRFPSLLPRFRPGQVDTTESPRRIPISGQGAMAFPPADLLVIQDRCTSLRPCHGRPRPWLDLPAAGGSGRSDPSVRRHRWLDPSRVSCIPLSPPWPRWIHDQRWPMGKAGTSGPIRPVEIACERGTREPKSYR